MKRKWSKKELALLAKYAFYGHFYTYYYKGQPVQECRSVLEIVKRGHLSTIEKDQILNATPDAIIIMMNPGSSVDRLHLTRQI